MKNNRIIVIIIIILLIGVIFSIYTFKEANVISSTYDIFEVSHNQDDSRTFTVMLNEKGYENEDGAWASLQLAPSYSFGVRFINVSIPANATIIDAYVKLFSTGSPGLDHPNCKIYCDNVDNAVNFAVVGVLNISGRNYTQNFTNWNETADYGKWVKTPSIAAQIQEAISRKNWTSGNSIAVLFVTNGYKRFSATFQNFERGYPAKLYVDWKRN